MPRALFSALLVPFLIAACSSSSPTTTDTQTDASSDSPACTGTPPVTCDGCCGSKYAADDCVDGVWSCRPLGGACIACDAGVTDAAADAPTEASATCTGTPPVICNGCCGAKYAADNCVNGVWSCRPLAVACIICDAGTTDAAADAPAEASTCTGTAPLCFGNDVTRCCGNDPAGPAVCTGGAWMCGSAPAPGCNGMTGPSCLLQDAASD